MNVIAQLQEGARPTLLNPEAEASLVGAMLIENKIVDRIADRVSSSDFGVPLLGRMFAAIVGDVARGRSVSPVTLMPLFESDPDLRELGGRKFMVGLTAAPEAMLLDPLDTARHVVELADRRRMRDGLTAAIESLSDLSQPLADASNLAEGAISAREDSSLVEVDAHDAMKSALAALDSGIDGVQCRIIPAVDELCGPLEPKSLTIVAGRPGMGKTAFSSSYALGAAQAGHGVLFVSLEMSADQLSHRMLADNGFDDAERRIQYSAIQQRSLNQWQRKQIEHVAANIARLPLRIVDAASLSVDRLDMMVRRQKRRFAARGASLDLVIVDYLQLLHPASKKTSAYEAISEVSRKLKSIAKEHDVAVMALAQLSRAVEQRPDKRPQLSDLRDSGQIEQDADAVMFLYREEYYVRQAEPRDDPEKHGEWESRLERCRGVIDFLLPKRRNGSSGNAQGRFFAPYQAVR